MKAIRGLGKLAVLALMAAIPAAAFAWGNGGNGGGNSYYQSNGAAIAVNPNGPTVLSGTVIRFIPDNSKKTEGTVVLVDNAQHKCGVVITAKTVIADAAKKPKAVKDIAQGKAATVSFVKDGDSFTALSITL